MELHEALTEREHEILTLLAEGYANREIAQRLHLTYKTVKWYNTQIYSKLGVSNRDGAVEQAHRLDLLQSNQLEAPTRHNLPHQTTRFIGRQQELDALAQLIADPANHLVTLLAPGGMGKTRLALAVAEGQLTHFSDGVFFVSLAPLNSSDNIVSAIAENVGFSFYGSTPPKQQLLDYLCSRNLLLVLDNIEHLLEGVSLLTDILQFAPHVRMLTTSREKLNLINETVFTLSGLNYPHSIILEDALQYDAVKLFMQRARRIRPDIALQPDDLDELVSICRLTEGLPLALELAAGWVDVLTLEQIAGELQNGIDILETELRDMPERHRSIRATFERTWQRLNDNERKIFGRLSIFRGGFTTEAAKAVTEANLRQLRTLVDKGLIQALPTGRYDIHELLRQFAAEKLDQLDMTLKTAQNHLDYVIALADEAEKHHFGRDQVLWFDRLEVDIENIRAALARSLQADELAKGLHLASGMSAFWSVRNHDIEGNDWFNRLLAVNRDTPAQIRARALYQATRHTGIMGDKQRARAYGEEAVALSRSLNDPTLLGWSLLNLNKFVDAARSDVVLEESLELFRALDNSHGVNNALRMQCGNAIRRGEFKLARQLLDEILQHSSAGGHTIGLAQGHEFLGVINWYQHKNLELTRFHLEESHPQYVEAGSSVFAARVQTSLGLVEHTADNDVEAHRLFEKAYRVLKEMGYLQLPLMEYILVGLGIVASKQEDYQRAVMLFAAAEDAVKNETIWLEYAFVDTYDQDIALLHNRLDDPVFAEAWARGKAMTRGEVLNFAFSSP